MTPTPLPTAVLLYVESTAKSTAFYEKLLGRAPVESQANFAMFLLEGGHTLGLWARHDVEPGATSAPGAFELGIGAESDAQVDALFQQWSERGWTIAQTPTRMDFGYTFLGLDPDGHRIRVYALAGA